MVHVVYGRSHVHAALYEGMCASKCAIMDVCLNIAKNAIGLCMRYSFVKHR